MKNFQQKTWFWKRRSRLFLESRQMQSNVSKIKGSLLAVFLGLIIGAIIIGATKNNPLIYFQYLLFFAFSSDGFNNWDNTLVWWSIFIMGGLSLLMSFKTGMFNIGITGQILASGAVVLAIGIRYDFSTPIAILVAILAAIAVSVLVALVISLLKVLFNVHEVVTSILLNWIIWFLIKWSFNISPDLYNEGTSSSMRIHDSMNLAIAGYKFILPLVLSITLVLFVWFLLKKTTLGYKVKTVGMNPFASNYAGISRKKYSCISFAISGALAGVMGFIYYIAMNPSISFTNDLLPSIGFDSISVTLVGQVNPLGTAVAAFLWGVIKSGGPIGSVGLGIPNAIGDIIFGAIIYSAACAVLLSRFSLTKPLLSYFNVILNNNRRKKFHSYLGNIWKKWLKIFTIKKYYKQKIKIAKKESSSVDIISDLKVDRKEDIKICFFQIKQEYQTLKKYFATEYFKTKSNGVRGIFLKSQEAKKNIYANKLNKYISVRSTHEELLYDLNQNWKNEIALLKKKQEPLINKHIQEINYSYKNKIEQAKDNFSSQFNQIISDEKQKLVAIKKQYQENKAKFSDCNKKNMKGVT